MAEHDPDAFVQLFDSEPGHPTPDQTAKWSGIYTRLVALLERQLEETEDFSAAVPEALREYLSRENIKILVEELEIFRGGLAHWQKLATQP